MALDRDGDLLRQVPAPGQHAADQGVVDAEQVAFFADPLFGGVGDGVEVGALARVQVHDHEPADVVEQRGDGELVALGPADRAADLVGGVLGREGVDPEPLGPQVAAAVLLEEVEDGGGAGDREDPGGLEDFDRLGDAGGAAGRARRGWRRGARRSPGRRRTRPLRPPRRCGRSRRSPPSSPVPGTRPGPGSGRPPRRQRPGVRRARVSRPPWRARRGALTLPFVCVLVDGMREGLRITIGSGGRSV